MRRTLTFILVPWLAGFPSGAWAAESVVVIKLRTPRNQQDARFDPYYDLGAEACFGITGCHRSNVMHPLRIRANLQGKRVAFVQQGMDPRTGVSQQRLVFLSPVLRARDFEEVGTQSGAKVALLKWNGLKFRPLKFASAPVLVANNGRGVLELVRLAKATRRTTIVAGFGSLFRTRVEPLNSHLSELIAKAWSRKIEVAKGDPERHFAETYSETMSPPPTKIDRDRGGSFLRFLERALNGTSETCVDAVVPE